MKSTSFMRHPPVRLFSLPLLLLLAGPVGGQVIPRSIKPTPTPAPCVTVWSENFDELIPTPTPTPPAVTGWVISTIEPDTPPNNAFCPDPPFVSDRVLDFPGITIPLAFAQLGFRNNFNMEFSDGIFWDGGVLEVSSPNIAGGAFTDITHPAVNAGFFAGGYTGTISVFDGNPLAGRPAWSGNSEGYINTIVNLGPNLIGQTITLRFRMGSDNAVGAPGWRIDTLRITTGACEGTPTPTPSPVPPCEPTLLVENFDDITTLPLAGWVQINHSTPIGTTGWFQGLSVEFPAHGGAPTSYIAANHRNGIDDATLSNWLLTPPLPFQNGLVLFFWTRTISAPQFADRLQVRMSTNGTSTNVGTTATDVGDFTTLLLDINPTYTLSGYPNHWIQYTPVVSGVPSPTTGRFAFRYFVENGGTTGGNSDYIGIDTVEVAACLAPTPTPGPTATPCPGGTPCPPSPTPTPGPATHFAFNTPTSWPLWWIFPFTVTAQDQFNNTATDYAGTVHFTSSASPAGLPPDSTLINGIGTFDAALGIKGPQTITATDAKNFITGTSNLIFIYDEVPPTATPSPTSTPIATPTPTATPTPAARAINLSTRLLVGTGDDVGIGGFIITGTDPKQVLLRGIGPSLGSAGVPNPLADPVLELHGPGTFVTITNNNWKDTQQAAIEATGIPPTNDLESAILVTLDPGAYTAILSGNNNGAGVGLVEIYDLSQGPGSKLGNISTRAFAGTGSDIVITGFILGGGSGDDAILVRGLGPSLTQSGVPNALANPTLELRNGEGALVASNDDWQNGPPVSLPHPGDPLESAIDATVSPGGYTALLSGVNNGTGVGLVEVYDRGSP